MYCLVEQFTGVSGTARGGGLPWVALLGGSKIQSMLKNLERVKKSLWWAKL